MKAATFYAMRDGDSLWLKPQRAADYGLPDSLVTFRAIKERPGYSVPFIETDAGICKPQDFIKWEAGP